MSVARLVDVRDVKCGDKIVGLGRVRSYAEHGVTTRREATLWGDWGWRLSMPIGKGLCRVLVDTSADV